MADFLFLQKHLSKKWTILVPRRSERPKAEKNVLEVCPFCVGQEEEGELDRVSEGDFQKTQNDQQVGNSENQHFRLSESSVTPSIPNLSEPWLVRVIPNKYPFTEHHELIIHSPDHHKNIDELPLAQVVTIIKMYRKRFVVNQKNGAVILFHNRGEKAGESLPHPHTQLVVLPHAVKPEAAPLADLLVSSEGGEVEKITTDNFYIFCPMSSEWPDEVIIAPKKRQGRFGDVSDDEVVDLAKTLQGVLQSLTERLGAEFSFNFSIYPLFDWYLRITPRTKVIGGFEIATKITVVTTDPRDTFAFLREKLGK